MHRSAAVRDLIPIFPNLNDIDEIFAEVEVRKLLDDATEASDFISTMIVQAKLNPKCREANEGPSWRYLRNTFGRDLTEEEGLRKEQC
ncbi:hypothetical protein MLD38_031832 [Melastoma candidum]|uniref:Uncharacterized protein n=1 Tax=Melastoma candidum TaxID=119954 RepID=A0ACB9MQW8_9MYRT|nr:hypothetical protein MLD38_031832 [Melastoma candidum]